MNFLVDGAMLHEQEILTLYDYMDRNYILPPAYDKERYEKVSFGRWAIEEVIGLLADNPDKDVSSIVQEFAITLRAMAVRKSTVSYIFEIAADTVDEIGTLLGEKEVWNYERI